MVAYKRHLTPMTEYYVAFSGFFKDKTAVLISIVCMLLIYILKQLQRKGLETLCLFLNTADNRLSMQINRLPLKVSFEILCELVVQCLNNDKKNHAVLNAFYYITIPYRTFLDLICYSRIEKQQYVVMLQLAILLY